MVDIVEALPGHLPRTLLHISVYYNKQTHILTITSWLVYIIALLHYVFSVTRKLTAASATHVLAMKDLNSAWVTDIVNSRLHRLLKGNSK